MFSVEILKFHTKKMNTDRRTDRHMHGIKLVENCICCFMATENRICDKPAHRETNTDNSNNNNNTQKSK